MSTSIFVGVSVAMFLVLAALWMRVTGRDRDAAKLRRMRESIDWHRPGHRPRLAAGPR